MRLDADEVFALVIVGHTFAEADADSRWFVTLIAPMLRAHRCVRCSMEPRALAAVVVRAEVRVDCLAKRGIGAAATMDRPRTRMSFVDVRLNAR